MHEFITPIVDWLSTVHGTGRRAQYGWAIVLAFVVYVARMIGQGEASSQRKCLKSRVASALLERPLSASVVSEKEGCQSKSHAMLAKVGEGYSLEVLTSACSSEAVEKTVRVTVDTIDELERYLLESTCFLLSDFR